MGSPYTPVSVKYRILLLTACKRIERGIEPEIENENPLNLDDDTSGDEESIYWFDLQGTLKNIYDSNYPPPSKESPRAQWEKPCGEEQKRRFKIVFDNQEDEITFRNSRTSSYASVSEDSDTRFISESESFEISSSDTLLGSE